MRERLERTLGRTARAIWILTFHAACGRILRREAERLGYRSSFTIYDQADQVRLVKACLEELGKDPKRFTPRGIHSQISNAKNQLISPEEYTSRVASFWDQTVAEVYELYQRRLFSSNAVDFDDMLMLTVAGARALPRGARALAVDVPPRPRRRVPGHEPRPVPAAAAARREAPERVRRRRSGSVDLRLQGRRHPQHPRLRARLRRRGRRSRSSRTTARRTRSSRPRTRSSTTTATASRSGSGRSSDAGDPVEVVEVEDEHAEARFVAAEIARQVEAGNVRRRDRGLLPHERAVARARGRARPAGRPVPGDRRPAVLRASRDQGRRRVPGRCSTTRPTRSPLMRIANRPRRGIGDTLDPAARRARRRARHLALGGDRRPGGRRRGDRRSARAIRGVPDDRGVAHVVPRRSSRSTSSSEAVLERSGTIEAYEAERTIEARGRIENL